MDYHINLRWVTHGADKMDWWLYNLM